jgi:hypothetical protein
VGSLLTHSGDVAGKPHGHIADRGNRGGECLGAGFFVRFERRLELSSLCSVPKESRGPFRRAGPRLVTISRIVIRFVLRRT